MGTKGKGEGRILNSEQLNRLYASSSKVRVIKYRRLRWIQHAARIEGRCAFKILTGKPIGTRPLGSPRRRC